MHISVVIPLFNKECAILRTVRSVLNQTHSDFELIVVDDGSIDGGAEIVKSIDDSRVRLISQSNRGVSAARNRGVKESRADWVAFLDGDDEYEPKFLETVIRFVERHPDDDLSMVGTNYYINTRESGGGQPGVASGIHDYFELFADRRTPNNSSTTVVEKQKFLEVGGFPEDVRQFEDWIAWCKLAWVGSFGYISTPLSIYYREALPTGAVSRRPPSSLYEGGVSLCSTMECFLKKYPQSGLKEKTVRQCLNEFIINTADLLARGGAKRLSVNLLRLFRFRFFSMKRIGHIKSLFIQLAVPQIVKRMRWRLRGR